MADQETQQMIASSSLRLIVGLGNPGEAYAMTRHNIGFQAVDRFAKKQNWSFRFAKAFHGQLAEGKIGDRTLLLLKPETYMNSSGDSVRACISYYKIPLSLLLVVSDDIYLPLGGLRMRSSGGSGGHNGLKSIESHLGTQAYGRLRIGVGDRIEGDLADHVLSSFSKEEQEKLPLVLQRSTEVLELWIAQGITAAIQQANVYQEEKKPEKNEEI